jgi:phosphomevalonate kinase
VEELSQTLSPTNSAWTQKVLPLRLPPCTRILLADVAAGSDTPSLVGNVSRWRQANPEFANDLWNSLDEENNEFRRILNGLSVQWEKNAALYEEVANYLSSMQQIQVRDYHFSPYIAADFSHIQTRNSGKPIQSCRGSNNHLSIVS